MSVTTDRAPAPGSADWLRYMTASKVAAVVGTSPYESRFSLWHRMAGDIPPQEQTAEMTYGLVMESAITAWFASQHPGLTLDPGKPFWIVHPSLPWAAATPDGRVIEPDGTTVPLEVKTGRDAWEWGESGGDGPIPPGYYDQVQWQMACMGAPHAYVAADVMMSLRWYRIPFDPHRAAHLITEAGTFMASLAAREAPAINDGSTNTYLAVRQLHPDIEDVDYQVPDVDAQAFLDAHAMAAHHAELAATAKNRIALAMGAARRAVWNKRPLFTRQARGDGTPYLVAARNLPTLTPKDPA